MKLWAVPAAAVALTIYAPAAVSAAQPPPAPPAHVVIVVEENHSYDDVIGNQ